MQAILAQPPGPDSGLLAVRAPFAGTVLERALGLGAMVSPGDRTLLVADISRMWVQTALYEREVAAVLELQMRQEVRAEVTVPAYPGRSFPGVVERVAGTLDEATRTARARVVVDNPGNLLRAGMLARVRLLIPAVGETLAAPADAVLDDGGRQFVFVRWKEPYFVRRPVRPGRVWPGWVEITEGLSPGQEVVARGAFLLKSDVLRSKMGAGCAD
jgi:RND family efflux transporter MFP subunit